jgi:hypothetical protein
MTDEPELTERHDPEVAGAVTDFLGKSGEV